MFKAIPACIAVVIGATGALADTRQDCPQDKNHDQSIRACSEMILHDGPRPALSAGRGAAFPISFDDPMAQRPDEPELTMRGAVIVSFVLLVACAVLFVAIAFLFSA